MAGPTFSPASPRTIDPSPPLPASHEASQVHRPQTSHPALPLQTWKELLANGTEPGQKGDIFISKTFCAENALPLPRLDHKWMGEQESSLSKKGNALLLAFCTAFKCGSPEAGNTFITREKANAFKIGFTHEGEQYTAQCRFKSDGNIVDIEIADTRTPPSKLSLAREGITHKGNPDYFPVKRNAQSPLQMELYAEAKRLKSVQDRPSMPVRSATTDFQKGSTASASNADIDPFIAQPVIESKSPSLDKPMLHRHRQRLTSVRLARKMR